jgi:hypothetical protein
MRRLDGGAKIFAVLGCLGRALVPPYAVAIFAIATKEPLGSCSLARCGYGSGMGERELREKYGGKLDKAINRAIRTEIPEGNAALDTLTKLSGPAWRSGWTNASGNPTPEALSYQKHYRTVVEPMIAKVRRTWAIPPGRSSGPPAEKRASRPARSAPRAKPATPARSARPKKPSR